MGNLFKPEMTLQEMNDILEKYCLNHKGSLILAVKIFPVTEEDYQLLKNVQRNM